MVLNATSMPPWQRGDHKQRAAEMGRRIREMEEKGST